MLDLLKGNVLTHDNNSNKWLATDNPENFKINCNDAAFKEKWKNVDITYNLNSQGYRCPEWHNIDWENSVIIFGDSCVAGVGVPKNDTISAFLTKLLNRPVINLGVSGSSNLFSLYNMIRVKNANINPYAVINIETTPERTLTFETESLGKTGINHWGSWSMRDIHYKKFWLKYEENYGNHNYFIRENKFHLWENTRYLNYSVHYGEWKNNKNKTIFLPVGESRVARDALHPGADSYRKQAELIKRNWVENGWMD